MEFSRMEGALLTTFAVLWLFYPGLGAVDGKDRNENNDNYDGDQLSGWVNTSAYIMFSSAFIYVCRLELFPFLFHCFYFLLYMFICKYTYIGDDGVISLIFYVRTGDKSVTWMAY